MTKRFLGGIYYGDPPEDPADAISERCDRILERSQLFIVKRFGEIDDSEVDGIFCKYFNEVGDCLKVNSETGDIEFISKDAS